MNFDSIRRRLVSLGLVFALIGASLPLNAGAAQAASWAQLGTVAYDFQSDELVLPIRGAAPQVAITQLASRQFLAELHGCTLSSDAQLGNRTLRTPLAGWSLSEAPGKTGVQLRLVVRDAMRPVVRFDRVGSRLVIGFERVEAVAFDGTAQRVGKVKLAATHAPTLPARPVRPRVLAAVKSTSAAGQKAAGTRVQSIARSLPQRPVPPVPLVLLSASSGADVLSSGGGPAPAAGDAKLGVGLSQVHQQAEVSSGALASRRLLSRTGRELPLVLMSAANPPARSAQPAKRVARKPASIVAKPSRKRTAKVVRLGVPRFDAAGGRLVVPVVAGELVSADVASVRLNKRWSYIDVAGARPTFGGVRYEERPDFTFQRWVMARRPGQNSTRVSFASGVHVDLDVKVTSKAISVAVVPRETVLASVPRQTAARPENSRAAFYASRAPWPAGKDDAPEDPEKLRRDEELTLAMAKRNPVPAGVIETRVRRPFYDEERFGLAIPYEGRTPLFRYASKDQNSAVIELKADVLSAAHLQEEARRNLNWGSWKLNRKSRPGVLTLELDFAKPSEISIAADPERKQLLIIPQPKLSQVAVAEASAVRASLSPVQLDRTGEHIFIPFKGEVPRYVLEQVTPTFAYVVFEAAALRDAGVQFQTPADHPRLNYTLVTQPEGTSTVRLAVCLARPAAAAVFQDPSNTRLVVSIGQDAPLAQSTGPRALQIPQPWPGALREIPSVPTSALQTNS
jgi:hypothetical protein